MTSPDFTIDHMKSATIDQLDWHWRTQLRPRLDGLSDAEYRWEPVPGAWNVRERGASNAPMQGGSGAMTIDFAFPEPVPAPVTTIAWRLGHVIVGVLAVRNAAHLAGPAADYMGWDYAATAAAALAQLDEQYATWIEGIAQLDWASPCGPAEGAWAEAPFAALALHINREVIHHGAEIALLRDLYAHQ